MPQSTQPLDLGEPPAPYRLRLPAPIYQGLQVLQQLPHFPPAQAVAATQESDHGGQPRTERPPRDTGRQGRAGALPTGRAAAHGVATPSYEGA
jgi:hypothetical protein